MAQLPCTSNAMEEAGLIIVGAGPTGVELACKLADLIDGAASVRPGGDGR